MSGSLPDVAPTSAFGPGAREYLLCLADDEHMVGARHTAWIGLGPFLEEDLAFCSIAQDELGHAIALYELILTADGRDPAVDLDAFALLRSPGQYRSSHLAEIECAAWADSLVRHWLYDRAEALRWTALLESSSERLAAIAARATAEERFHTEHAERFMARVAGTPQIEASVERLLPLAVAAWGPLPGEADALADGVATIGSEVLAAEWRAAIDADAHAWNLTLHWPGPSEVTSTATTDRAVRSEGFSELLASLTRVLALDPSATW